MKDILSSEKQKKILPYIGLPILCTIYIISKGLNNFDSILSLLIIIFGYRATVTDIKGKVIENKLIIVMIATWALALAMLMIVDIDAAIIHAINGGTGFLVGGGLFMFLYIVSRKGLGAGDVKFMSMIGLYLGASIAMSVMFYGSVFLGIVVIALLAIKKIGKKDTIFFGPFLYLATLLILFLGG